MTTTTTPLRNFIDGDFSEPAEGGSAPVMNPATGEAYLEAPVSSAADVDRAMEAAASAFATWRLGLTSGPGRTPFLCREGRST